MLAAVGRASFSSRQVFNCELEKAVPDFHEFDDFCNSFPLSRGKNIEEEDSSHVGEFKVRAANFPSWFRLRELSQRSIQ